MEACNFPVHAFTMHLTANQRLACPICLLQNSQFEVKSDTNLMNHLQSVHGDMEPRKLEFSGVRQASVATAAAATTISAANQASWRCACARSIGLTVLYFCWV